MEMLVETGSEPTSEKGRVCPGQARVVVVVVAGTVVTVTAGAVVGAGGSAPSVVQAPATSASTEMTDFKLSPRP